MRSLYGLQKPQKLRITTAGLPRAGFQPTEVLASGIEIPGGKALSRPLQDVPTGGRAHIFGAAINSSRAVLYASNGADFATAARSVALATRDEIRTHSPR